MDLRDYPFDVQTCFLAIESCKYITILVSISRLSVLIQQKLLVTTQIIPFFIFFDWFISLFTQMGIMKEKSHSNGMTTQDKIVLLQNVKISKCMIKRCQTLMLLKHWNLKTKQLIMHVSKLS